MRARLGNRRPSEAAARKILERPGVAQLASPLVDLRMLN